MRKLTSSLLLICLLLSACGGRPTANPPTPTGSGQPLTTPPLAQPCPNSEHGEPQITGLSPTTLRTGQSLNIVGCNFAGFEGDIRIWIENELGEQGLLLASNGATANHITLAVPAKVCRVDVSYSGQDCPTSLDLATGNYYIYAAAWGQTSNRLSLVIK